jgi:hypothetical protein
VCGATCPLRDEVACEARSFLGDRLALGKGPQPRSRLSWSSYRLISHRLGSMPRVEDPHHFLDRAFEYYLSGRFAALNNLKIAPNLFHYAIEMLAKFQLLRRVPDDRLADEVTKLKRKPYSHNLNRLWSKFKASVDCPSLDRFDAVVAELNRWENLRYGGLPVGISTTMVFMVRRGPHKTGPLSPRTSTSLYLRTWMNSSPRWSLQMASIQAFWVRATGSSPSCVSCMRKTTFTP